MRQWQQAALIVLLGFAGLAVADLPKVAFDIPARPMEETLKELGRVSGLNVVVNPELTRGMVAPKVMGSYTPTEALNLALSHTGLRLEYLDDKTVAILATKDMPAASPTANAAMTPKTLRLAQAADMPQASSLAAPQKNDAVRVEEIVVSAQKRTERLQDVPISMSVLTGAELDRSTTSSAGDVLSRVPGVLLDGGSGSTAAGMQLAMRGVGAPSSFASGPSPVSYYLDTVPFGMVRTSSVPDANVYDLERIEVLRGPQGTLYGASAQAGVVRILTRDPDLDAFELKSRGILSNTQDGGQNGQVDAAVNVPIIEGKLAARAVVGYQDLSGWVDKSTRSDVNDSRQRNARLKLKAQPTEQTSITVSGWMSRGDDGALDVATDGQGLRSVVADVESVEADFEIYGLKIAHDLHAFSVESTTGYLDYVSENFVGENGSPPRALADTRLSAKAFSQEVNFISALEGPWRWTAGGIYRDGRDLQFQDIRPNLYPTLVKYTSESWAVFGELTRKFLDGKLELTAGLRHFEDRVGQINPSNAGNFPPPIGTGPPAQDNFHATTPRIILNWHPHERSTVYASYAEGFRSGLHQNPVVRLLVPGVQLTQPDLLKNYEIGTKGNLLDGRVGYEVAVYYMDWRDVQLPLGLDIGGITRNLLVNGTSASGLGTDFALTVEPIDGLDLGLNFSWNDLAVDSPVRTVVGTPPVSVLLFDRGDRLNGSIETTAGAEAGYRFALGNAFRGKIEVAANTRTRLSTKRVVGTALTVDRGDPVATGRASFTVEAPDRWSAALFVDNVTNEQDKLIPSTAFSTIAGTTFGIYPRPRTIGVQLEFNLQ